MSLLDGDPADGFETEYAEYSPGIFPFLWGYLCGLIIGAGITAALIAII
jgi:hypothetical protein